MAPSGQPAATSARRRTTSPGTLISRASTENSVGVSATDTSPSTTACVAGSSRAPSGVGRIAIARRSRTRTGATTPLALSARQTSRPSTSGRPRSSTMTSGWRSTNARSASAPVATLTTSKSSALKARVMTDRSCASSSQTPIVVTSPDPDALRGVQPQAVTLDGAEHLVELVEVAHDVGPELRGTVRVDGEVLQLLLLAALGAPAVGPVHEEPLPLLDGRLAALGDEVRRVADREATEVADVLTDGQRAVDVLAGEGARLEGVVLLDQRLRLHLEGRLVGRRPPVVEGAGAV